MSAADSVSEHGRVPVVQAEHLADAQDLARALTLVREMAGLSIRDVARRTGIPSATLGGYYSGRHLPARPHETLVPMLRACGVPDEQFPSWIDALVRARRTPGPRPAQQPYRGLANFDAEDAKWFFGREEVTQRLIDKISAVIANPEYPAIVVVTGPSGSGKSSLLRAGLIPTFGGQIDAITPGDSPLSALARALAGHAACSLTEVEAALRADVPPGWVSEVAPALLVVDQFEEIFTAGVPKSERDLFVSSLRRLTVAGSGGCERPAVVLGLRNDFYRDAGELPGLLRPLETNQIVLGSMTEAELRSAIVEPARHAGGMVDDNLVELVLRDMSAPGGHRYAHDPGALPLMSHALMETWKNARRSRLTKEDYLATGGIRGAAQQTAEALYSQLDEARRALVRRIFLRLANAGDSQPVTRRRAAEDELLSLSEDHERVVDILNRFVASRLLTSDSSDVEISHESLLTAWPRLAAWIEDDRASQRRLRQLTSLAQQWETGGRDEDELLRGLRLETVQEWLNSDPRWAADLNRTERDFVNRSATAERERLHQSRRALRRTRQLLTAVSALAVVAALLAASALDARSSSQRSAVDATTQRDLARSRQLAYEAGQLEAHDPNVASKIALAGYQVSPTVEARSALLDSVAVPSPTRLLAQPGITKLALSADGRSIALTNAAAGSVQLLNRSASTAPVRVGLVPGLGSGHQLFTLAYSPRSAILATGGQDALVRLWDVSDPARPQLIGTPLRGIEGAVETVAFSPDGHLMLAGGADQTIRIWNVADPGHPTTVGAVPVTEQTVVQSIAFAPNGTMVAVGGTDGLLQRWNIADPARPSRLPNLAGAPPKTATVYSVAFSPDGRFLATGRRDGTVQVWGGATGSAPVPVPTGIPRFNDWVNAVGFSPDGRSFAVASSNNSVVTWSVPSWREQRVLPHAGPVDSASYLPDGSGMLTASEDGSSHLWPIPGPLLGQTTDNVWSTSAGAAGLIAIGSQTAATAARLWTIDGGTKTVGTVAEPAGLASGGTLAVSPDGQLLALGAPSGDLSLWKISTASQPRVVARVPSTHAFTESVAFDPRSRLLAEAGDDDLVHLWNIADPSHPRPLPSLAGATDLILNVAVSPDSRTVAAASVDGTVRLWDVSSPAAPFALAVLRASDANTDSVAFSPDGRVLSAGSSDHLVRLWSVADRAHPVALGSPLTGPTDTVFGLSISPDSRLLAAASGDRTVYIWDISNARRPTRYATLRASSTSVYAVTFTSSGSQLVAGGGSGEVHVWPVSVAAAADQICKLGGDPMTRAEWATYAPDQPFRSTCGAS